MTNTRMMMSGVVVAAALMAGCSDPVPSGGTEASTGTTGVTETGPTTDPSTSGTTDVPTTDATTGNMPTTGDMPTTDATTESVTTTVSSTDTTTGDTGSDSSTGEPVVCPDGGILGCDEQTCVSGNWPNDGTCDEQLDCSVDGKPLDGEDCHCGDGEIQAKLEEECDNGNDNGNNAVCTASCKMNVCGDGHWLNDDDGQPDPNEEECDNGIPEVACDGDANACVQGWCYGDKEWPCNSDDPMSPCSLSCNKKGGGLLPDFPNALLKALGLTAAFEPLKMPELLTRTFGQ